MVLILATMLLALDAWFFLNTFPLLFFIALALFVLLLLPSLHIFALMSIQTNTIKEHCKQAFIISIRHITTTITVLIICMLWLLSIYALPISGIFSAGPATILASMFLRSLYKRIDVYPIQ